MEVASMKQKKEEIDESKITYVKIVQEKATFWSVSNALLLGGIGNFIGAFIRIALERMWQ